MARVKQTFTQMADRRKARRELVRDEVGKLFRRRARDVYSGKLTTLQVLCYVSMVLNDKEFRLTPASQEEIYKAMVELGPCGEDDQDWIQVWGRGA